MRKRAQVSVKEVPEERGVQCSPCSIFGRDPDMGAASMWWESPTLSSSEKRASTCYLDRRINVDKEAPDNSTAGPSTPGNTPPAVKSVKLPVDLAAQDMFLGLECGTGTNGHSGSTVSEKDRLKDVHAGASPPCLRVFWLCVASHDINGVRFQIIEPNQHLGMALHFWVERRVI